MYMDEINSLKEKTELILEISSLLMVSGASTARVNSNIERFSSVLNCEASSFVSHKSIVTTLSDKNSNETFTKVVNIPGHQINFQIIASISKASWSAIEDGWDIGRIKSEIDNVKNIVRYPRIVVLLAVSIAGAGFCKIFGGDYSNMLMAFVSTFIGLFIAQSSHKKGFNHYIGVYLGAFTASSVAYISAYYRIGMSPEATISTSVLFLIPGVALINSFSDMLDNRFLIGMARLVNGLVITSAIAFGVFSSTLIYNLFV
jgi:uncharacterized membrane protein YjjP (DUF1212 family)